MQCWSCWSCWWLALALAGCSDVPERELQTWLQAQRGAALPQLVPLAVARALPPPFYPAASLADPFDMGKLYQGWQQDALPREGRAALASPDQRRHKQVLEQFPLDAMTMVGSLERQGRMTGLLRVEQLLYQVQVGQYLGQNHGRIVQISEARILLRELVLDTEGAWTERASTLDLLPEAR